MSFKNGIILFFTITCGLHTTAYTNNILSIFSHGIADNWKQVHGYVKSYIKHDALHHNDRYILHSPYVTFNYPDATTALYRVNYNETSFGQANEIAKLNKTYNKAINLQPDCDIILYGLSRGASNVLIFAGLYTLPNVKALILESPYFTMGDVIESLMLKKNLSWLPLAYGETVAEFIFKKYTRYGHSPANCIETIAQNMPIFIVCSKEDRLVPFTSTINVYKKLIASGHKNTYIFITDHGRHAAILQGLDGEIYQWVVNTFYKKYNLPHCSISALKGESILATCQPIFD